MIRYLKALTVLLVVGMSLLPNELFAQPSRSPWQMHEGLEITPENPYGVTPADPFWPTVAPLDPIWYSTAVIPDAADAGWEPAPDGDIIAFGGPSASVIDEAGYSCWQAYDYSYFHTYVTVPENTTLTDFTISFSGMDDGARITIINSAYPAGLVIPGSYVTGGGTATSDLASYVTTGENRVVITQIDVCPNGNTLASAVVVLNGETVIVNNAPVANAGPDQSVTRTGALTNVTLDGSASADADVDDVLLYNWSWTGGTASGVSPTISLASGIYDITLTVDDQNGETDTDVVQILVDETAYEQTFTVLGAVGNAGETDPYIQALPEGATEWSQAYLIGGHPWGLVPGTNSWLNFHPDNTVGTNTSTPYRIRFMVPEDAVDPSMVFQVKADNLAIIYINDTYVDSIIAEGTVNVDNSVAGAALHTGLNEIRITMVDWGSIVGINYRIDVTMTSAEDITDAVLTPEDAAELNNPPLADAGLDLDFSSVYPSYEVTLDASGSSDPDGNLLSYTWSESGIEIATGETPTLTLDAGVHTITLTAFDGELSSTDDVIVTIEQTVPLAAGTPDPASESMDVSLDAGLSWASVEGATGYRINLGTADDSLSMENGSDLGDMLSYTPSALDYATTYYWSITPYNAAGSATTTHVWSFTTEGAPIPAPSVYLNPADGSVDHPQDVLVQWELSDGATGYLFNIGTDNPPTNVAMLDLGATSDFFQDPALIDYETTYYWSVTPYNASGQATGVEVWSFTTGDAPATEQTFTVYGAIGNAGETDPYIQALPEGATEWQQAYLIGPHPWGQVEGTTSWINFDPNPEVGVNTRTPYRIRFMVPEDAVDPSMMFHIKADNRAIIWVNDTFIDSVDGENTLNVADAVIGEALHTGVNEIRISLVDFGSIVGINYRIDVTMTSAEDISDALLTPEDAELLNNAPIADAGLDQVIETYHPDADVTLDASGSSDEDGNLLTYTWNIDGEELAFGEVVTVNLAAGTHIISMTASDGELSDTDDVEITITQLAPMASSEPYPMDASTEVDLNPELSWSSSEGAIGYRISLGSDNPPTSIALDMDLGDMLSYYPESLDYSTMYYWHVTPYNEAGDAMDVMTWTFTTMDETMTGAGESCENPIVFDAFNSAGMVGNLDPAGHDWYSFSTDGSLGEITISTCNSTGIEDTKLAVFADCADFIGWPEFGSPVGTIAYNDDACGLYSEVSLLDLPEGTYYAVVYGYSPEDAGEYTLQINHGGAGDPCDDLADMYEPNDVLESAVSLENGFSIEAAICPVGDSDWFVINGFANSWITIQTTNISFDEYDTDTYLSLYNEDGDLLAADDDGADVGYLSSLSVPLMSDGLYYIEVRSSPFAPDATFDYGMSIMFEDGPQPGPQNLVAMGGSGVVNLTWNPAPMIPFSLQNPEGISPLKTNNLKANLHPEKLRLNAIFAAKEMQARTHRLEQGIREMGETCAEAYEYGSVNSPAVQGELAVAGQQWYSFTTDGSFAGIAISLCNSVGVTDPQLAVFADCGDVVDLPYFAVPPTGAIAHNDDACELNAEIIMPELPAGTYYVAVWGYTAEDFGAYELGINEINGDCIGLADAYEPNNMMGEATPAADGDTFEAALCPTEDSDFFAVSGLASQVITFETMPLNADEFTTDTYLNLYDEAGNLLDSDDDSGFMGYTSMISYELPADGTVYFQVMVSESAAGSVFDYLAHVSVEDPMMNDFTFNIYRDEALLVSGISVPMYDDFDVSNGTEYCYTVTQVFGDLNESEHSNVDCATPAEALAGDVCNDPIPLMLPVMGQTGSSEGYNNDYGLWDFMSGIDIVYSFSVPVDGTISGNIADAGFEWTAMFIMDGCPDGESVLIAEASGSSGGSFDHAPIAAGDYYLIVSNWPTPDAFSYTFDLDFQPGEAPMVDLLSPVSHMMVSTLTPEFLWQTCPDPYQVPAMLIGGDKEDILAAEEAANNAVELVVSYDFYLGMTPDLSDAMAIEVIGGRFTPAEPLMEDMIYFWAVSANDDDGGTFYSDTTSFWTNSMNSAPLAFSAMAPMQNGIVETLTPTFSWEAAFEVDLYDEVVYNIYMGPSPEAIEMVYTGQEQGILGTEFTLIEPIQDNMTYFWRVEARDMQGAVTTNTEGYQSFHVNLGNDAPSVVDLVTPDSVLVLTLTPEMYWTASVDMDPQDVVSYEMHWWGAGMEPDSVLTDTHAVILPRELADNSMYYWNVIAMDSHGGISHSAEAFFWTDLAPEPPSDFALLSPANDATGQPDLPVFAWEAALDPDPMDYATYTLEVSTDAEFSEIISTTETYTEVGFEMTESLPGNSEYWWRVTATDADDLSTVSATYKFTVGTVSTDDLAALPDAFVLQQNYPNPFNPTTTIRYGIPEDASVTLMIYDVRGNVVKTVESGHQSAGWYEVTWNGLSDAGQPVPTGLYMARFHAGNYSHVVKMLYLK